MKKRIILILLIFIIISVIAFGQETTWINPFTNTIPGSMLGFVSSGLWYDEIDVILRSPAELSNYSGYNIITTYGNYESWRNAGAVGITNPFTTNTLTSGANIEEFVLGMIFPLLDYRLGVATGFQLSRNDNLNIGSATQSIWTQSTTHTEDSAPLDGTTDYTYANSENYTDSTSGTLLNVISGIDIGFMGLSLQANINTNNRTLGGSYIYNWTAGTTTAVNDQVTNKTVYYGSGTDGAASSYPYTSNGASSWSLSALGELPLNLLGYSMPVTTSLMFTGKSGSSTPIYNPPMSVSYTTTNVTGASTPADTSILSYTVGHTMIEGGWDPNSDSGIIAGISSQTSGALRGLIGTAYSTSASLDTKAYKDSNFTSGLTANIDPVIPVNDILKVRTRVNIAYSLTLSDNTQSATESINYSESNTAATNSAFSYTEDINAPAKGTTNNIRGEVGGIVELRAPSGIVTIGTGLFYDPNFNFMTTDYSEAVTHEYFSWQDTTNIDPLATAATTNAESISPLGSGLTGAGNQGSSSRVTTKTYDGSSITNIYTHNFYLPVAVKIRLKKDKLYLISGYTLNHFITTSYTRTPAASTDVDTLVFTSFDRSGTAVYTETGGNTTVTVSEVTTKTVTAWMGIMNFMLRWMPTKSITVDFFGQGIMNALNFTIFGDATAGKGFNPANFIGFLSMSVSYHIPSGE